MHSEEVEQGLPVQAPRPGSHMAQSMLRAGRLRALHDQKTRASFAKGQVPGCPLRITMFRGEQEERRGVPPPCLHSGNRQWPCRNSRNVMPRVEAKEGRGFMD